MNFIDTNYYKQKIVDGFQIPNMKTNIRCTGSYLEKNAIGYYKTRYICLSNQEMYLYNDLE